MKLAPTTFHPLFVASTDVLLGFLLIHHWRWPGERGKGQRKCIQSSICRTISIAPLFGWLQEMNDMSAVCFQVVILNICEQKKRSLLQSLHRETSKANICLESVAYNDY